MNDLDPITLSVVRGGVISLCSEMGIAMEKSSYSPIFSEGEDYSYAMFDGQGEMIAYAAFDPTHLAAMPLAVRESIKQSGLENLEAGDIVLQNDPYSGGSHISDFTAIMPVFYKGELIAFPAARAHQIDSGGMVAGGFAGDAHEIFQEGLRIPPIKINSRYREVEDLWKLLIANVRVPSAVRGDLRAMFGSLAIGEKRIIEFLEKFGVETWNKCMSEIKNISERIIRQEIRKIPSGVYEYENYIDDYGNSDRPAKVHVRLKVKDDHINADFSKSSKQVSGPVNAAFAVTSGATTVGVLNSVEIGEDYVVNHGTLRAIKAHSEPGTIVNPNFPAPVQGGNTELYHRIVETVIGALAEAGLCSQIKACCHGTAYALTAGGFDPKTGKNYVIYHWSLGGMGAGIAGDGSCALYPFSANGKGPYVEINELRYPILFDEFSLIGPDLAGPGKFRGGIGTKMVWRLTSDECQVSCLAERHKISPYGVFGGLPPLPLDCGHFSDTRLSLEGRKKAEHATELYGKLSPSKWSGVTLRRNEAVEIILSGGGGWGNPFERDPEFVLVDVLNNFVSVEGARRDYGVALTRNGGELMVDQSETKRLRTNPPDVPTDPKLKIFGSFLFPYEGDLSSIQKETDVSSVSKVGSGRDYIVTIGAKNYGAMLRRAKELGAKYGSDDVRLVTSQFVPADFVSP